MGRRATGTDWAANNRVELITEAAKQRAERARALIQSRPRQLGPQTLERPGISTATTVRYASTSSAESWAPLGAGRPLVDALLQSVSDGSDRALLAWPERPGNGFTLAGLALREARCSGRLASATLAVWPWRPALTRAARSILVHPADISAAARTAINELERGEAWTRDGLAHRSLDLVELRLRDLISQNAPPRIRRGRSRLDVIVRSPTLLETTAVFPASAGTFEEDATQVLRRVRDHTFMGNPGAELSGDVATLGNPAFAPFALFGIPAEASATRLRRLLSFERFRERGLDAIVVDLTHQSRGELPDTWERLLALLLQSLDAAGGRRPPIVALCDDPFSLRTAIRSLRTENARLRPRRSPPTETGAYLAEPGLLAPGTRLSETLPDVRFSADIKDASLVEMREELVKLGRRLRQERDGDGVRAVSDALSFLRRSASLPVGLDEAVRTADVLFDTEDDVDARVRAMFRPLMTLSRLAKLAEHSPAAANVRRSLELIKARAKAWADETPVSAKLADLMLEPRWNSPATLIAVPDRRVAEVLMGSDRSVGWHCAITDHRDLAEALDRKAFDRLIVTGPTPLAIRTLLTSVKTPGEVFLLGDSSGSALISGELAPLCRMAAFAPVARRAADLHAALHRGGLDERHDAGESEFRLLPQPRSRDIDLTQEGGAYPGEKVILVTASHRIVYRPSSDVLLFSPGEARPFERIAARDVQVGDHILVLDEEIRERIRRALATSRSSLDQLASYHTHIARLRAAVPGETLTDKSREVLRRMRQIDPSLPDSEVANIQRWLSADQAPAAHDGVRQPRTARDWPRFSLFMHVNGVDPVLAQTYWSYAIVPTRSYRAREGHQFNQRVVQFVLDPEGVSAGAGSWRALKGLWLSLVEAVDDVKAIEHGN